MAVPTQDATNPVSIPVQKSRGKRNVVDL